MPRNYWKDKTNQLKTLKEIEQQLNITEPTQWYEITNQDVLKTGLARNLLRHFGNSIPTMLIALYPEVQWKPTR